MSLGRISNILKDPIFQKSGAICSMLNEDHNISLKEFTKKIFQQVSEANKPGRNEKHVAKDCKFFDATAQILTGDGVCAAVAISGSDILIATNEGEHGQRAVQWHLTATIIDTDKNGQRLRLGFSCHLKPKTGKPVTKDTGPFEYQFDAQSEKAFLILGDPSQLNFSFSKGDCPYLPDDEIEVSVDMYRELDQNFFSFLLRQQKETVIPLSRPVVTYRGSLKRRAAKLFNFLSFIAQPILNRLPYLPQSCKPQYKSYTSFVETEYQQYKQSNQQRSEDEFIKTIRAKCRWLFQLDQPGRDTTENFLKSAREHYQVADLEDRALLHIERHKLWPTILNDSLTYELSGDRGIFSKDISFDSKPPKGVRELDQLYKDLVQEYWRYKSHHALQSSASSVTAWLDSLEENCALKLPNFVKARFSDFLKIARRYFIQLTFVEEYMKENAKQNGALAQRVAQETIFEKSNVKLMQGQEGVHAEMRLFSHHLLKKRPPANYYGIAKLCCALCHYTFQQFRASGIRPPETRGTHAALFKWPLPKALYDNTYMEPFLGDTLFKKYTTDLNRNKCLEISKKKGRKEKPEYHLQDAARAIISRLDRIRSRKSLQKLGLNESLQIQGSSDHYADNQIPPRLPPSHQNIADEEQLEVLKKTHHPRQHSSFFEPLEALGRAWRDQKNNSHAYYYLVRAAQILDQFPNSMDPLKAAKVLNILGNVCRSLELYDKALLHLNRALDLKKEHKASRDEIAKALNNLGYLYYDIKNLPEAYSCFTRALQSAQEKKLLSLLERNLARLNSIHEPIPLNNLPTS